MKLLLLDAMNLLRRVYEAAYREAQQNGLLFDESLCRTTAVNAIRSLRRAFDEVAPTHALCCFDGNESTWRHALYAEYKANREPMSETLTTTREVFIAELQALGIAMIVRNDLEADDIIGSICSVTKRNKIPTIILSTDKDFHQLIDATVLVRDHYKKETRDADWVLQRYGVQPSQFRDFLALTGDTVDNIPGVPGVGEARAAALLQRFGSIVEVIDKADYIEGKLGASIRKNIDVLQRSVQLVELKDDCNLGINLKDCVVPT